MNAKDILNRWLAEDDYGLLGQAVVDGYSACDEFMSKNIVFSEFALGREHRSHLLRVFVDHALNNVPLKNKSFKQELSSNKARNCWHIRLHKDGLVITSHFMGKRKFRKMARPAVNREILADMNGDLFAGESDQLDVCVESGAAYCNLLHGGRKSPDLSMLVIPNRDQARTIGASCHLPRPSPQRAKSEEITDTVIMQLRRQASAMSDSNDIDKGNVAR